MDSGSRETLIKQNMLRHQDIFHQRNSRCLKRIGSEEGNISQLGVQNWTGVWFLLCSCSMDSCILKHFAFFSVSILPWNERPRKTSTLNRTLCHDITCSQPSQPGSCVCALCDWGNESMIVHVDPASFEWHILRHHQASSSSAFMEAVQTIYVTIAGLGIILC